MGDAAGHEAGGARPCDDGFAAPYCGRSSFVNTVDVRQWDTAGRRHPVSSDISYWQSPCYQDGIFPRARSGVAYGG